jgi:GDP-4-dehydro-6-deoxy-D-mannose reductase
VTGATGFVGRHLIHELTQALPAAEIHGTALAEEAVPYHLHKIDLKDTAGVCALIDAVRPDHIYHLAALASPRLSFADPWGTLENNIRSQLNLFLACLENGDAPRILVISSAEIYQTDTDPLDENTPFNPTSPYGVSKIAQDMLAFQYAQTHHLPILRARPFNHIGPGQAAGFVATDFALQIARIEAGQQPPVIRVGNLAARRDFTDVRDVVRAYRLIVERGQPGAVYNIATGAAYSIQDLLDILLSFSAVSIEVQVDPSRFLPVDAPIKIGDARRLHADTGWQPTIHFEQTLHDILNDCRQRVQGSA